MSDFILLLFMIAVFGYVGITIWRNSNVSTNKLDERALRRRTDPVWKDRGTLK